MCEKRQTYTRTYTPRTDSHLHPHAHTLAQREQQGRASGGGYEQTQQRTLSPPPIHTQIPPREYCKLKYLHAYTHTPRPYTKMYSLLPTHIHMHTHRENSRVECVEDCIKRQRERETPTHSLCISHTHLHRNTHTHTHSESSKAERVKGCAQKCSSFTISNRRSPTRQQVTHTHTRPPVPRQYMWRKCAFWLPHTQRLLLHI